MSKSDIILYIKRLIKRLFCMKNEMLYIEILKYLCNIGIGKKSDIFSFFKTNIRYDMDMISFLSDMKCAGHIKYETEVGGIIPDGFGGSNTDSIYIISIPAYITYSGMDYITNYDLSLKTRRNLRNQFWIGIITVFVLICTAIIPLVLEYRKNDTDKYLSQYKYLIKKQSIEIDKLRDSLSTSNKHAIQPASKMVVKNP